MRLRLTVRRLMILVAALALLLGSGVWAYRRVGVQLYHRKQARMHALAESDAYQELDRHERKAIEYEQQENLKSRDNKMMHIKLAEESGKAAAHHGEQMRYHEAAASGAWWSGQRLYGKWSRP